MKRHFSVDGILCRLLTDNGSQISSRELRSFAEEWKFHRVTSSPHLPQSNGLVENAVKQAKTCLTNARRMVQILCLAFLISGMFHLITFLIALSSV